MKCKHGWNVWRREGGHPALPGGAQPHRASRGVNPHSSLAAGTRSKRRATPSKRWKTSCAASRHPSALRPFSFPA